VLGQASGLKLQSRTTRAVAGENRMVSASASEIRQRLVSAGNRSRGRGEHVLRSDVVDHRERLLDLVVTGDVIGEELDQYLSVGLADTGWKPLHFPAQDRGDRMRVPIARRGSVRNEGAVDIPQDENAG